MKSPATASVRCSTSWITKMLLPQHMSWKRLLVSCARCARLISSLSSYTLRTMKDSRLASQDWSLKTLTMTTVHTMLSRFPSGKLKSVTPSSPCSFPSSTFWMSASSTLPLPPKSCSLRKRNPTSKSVFILIPERSSASRCSLRTQTSNRYCKMT